MKKKLAFFLALVMVFSMTACSSSGSTDDTTAAAAETTVAETEAADTEGSEAEEAGSEEADSTEADETESTDSGEVVSIDETIDTVVGELSLNAEDFSDLDAVTLTVASSSSSSNFNYDVMVALADAITEQTGGKLSFNIVWDGNLGSDNELTESVEAGDIDIVFESTSSLANYIPESAVFDMPGLFTNVDEATEACRAFIDTWNEICADYNLVALDLACPMFRALSCNKEITTADDFSGISVRCAENEYYQAFYTNLGMSPTPLAFSELYLSLQQGLVDAQDNPISVIYASKFYEVQSYYLEINAIGYASNLLMTKSKYDSLDAAYQDALTQFATLFYDGCLLGQPAADQEAYDAIGDVMTVLEMNDDLQAAVTAAGEPVWDMIAEDIGEDVVNTFLACAGR